MSERRSASGSQLTGIRITSELRYYRKWSGPAGALLIAGIEIAWNCIVWCRNVFRQNELGVFRRKEAARPVLGQGRQGSAGKGGDGRTIPHMKRTNGIRAPASAVRLESDELSLGCLRTREAREK